MQIAIGVLIITVIGLLAWLWHMNSLVEKYAHMLYKEQLEHTYTIYRLKKLTDLVLGATKTPPPPPPPPKPKKTGNIIQFKKKD